MSLLEEHRSPFDSSGGPAPGYEPSPEEEKAIKLANKLLDKAKGLRKSYDSKWLDYYKMYRGKQWLQNRPSYRHTDVVNLIFRAINSVVPILTDTMPRPEFIPQEPSDFELAQILNDVLDSDWTRNNWTYVTTEIIYDSHFYGTGFGCLKWDAEADDGMGKIIYKAADPFYQFPDPYCRDINTYSRYYVEAEPEDAERVKAEHPEQAEFIKGDVLEVYRREASQASDQVRYGSPTDAKSFVYGTGSYDVATREEALVVKCYINDMTVVEEEKEETTAEGLVEKKYIQKLKYPKGRMIKTANNVLLYDGPIEYDDKKFPYIKLSNYIMPHEFWGMSEIEQLESPQKVFNKLVCFTMDVLTLMGNPVWLNPTSAAVDPDNLVNRPGLIIDYEGNTPPQRVEGVQLQPYVLQMIDRMKLWFDDVSGSTDASRGIRPEGVTAASAIEALQDMSNTRIRQKSRNIDAFLQDFGQMYLSRVFQYYTVPRIFRVTNDKNAVNYFKFHVEQRDELDPLTGQPTGIKKKFAKIRKFLPNEKGGYALDIEEKEFEVRANFDVKISTGSALPFEKARVESQTFNLFDRGIIDSEEVLKNIRYPNAESVMKRMAEKAAMQAQQQAMGAAPQGQAPIA